jgi:hypothetical protein
VVIVISPSEPELVLPRLLHLRRAVPPLPVATLGFEEEGAFHVRAER